VRLYHLTGEGDWRRSAENLIRAFTGTPDLLAQSPLLLAAADFLERGIVVVIAGPLDDPSAIALARQALASPDPATCTLRTNGTADWPENSPGHGKTMQDGAAAAYVCRGRTCSLPVTIPEELQRLLLN
jgi:uncharacterized protein YyaL (SSP411 family)